MDPKPEMTFRCTHLEAGGVKGQVVVTMRASEKDFGGTLILRIKGDASEYKLGRDYSLHLEEKKTDG